MISWIWDTSAESDCEVFEMHRSCDLETLSKYIFSTRPILLFNMHMSTECCTRNDFTPLSPDILQSSKKYLAYIYQFFLNLSFQVITVLAIIWTLFETFEWEAKIISICVTLACGMIYLYFWLVVTQVYGEIKQASRIKGQYNEEMIQSWLKNNKQRIYSKSILRIPLRKLKTLEKNDPFFVKGC